MTRDSRLVMLLLFVLAGCGGGASADDAGAAREDASLPPGTDVGTLEPDADSRPDAFIPSADQATLTYGPERLEPGDEQTVCIVLDAGNEAARFVRTIRTSLPQGSHHMILYRTTEGVRERPQACIPFASSGDAMFIAETREAELHFPADTGLAFDAHQHVRLEVHAVNYVGMPIDVSASATFEFYPLDVPPTDEVHLLFTGDMSLYLPPHEETTVTSFHRPDPGARIFAITSHTHSLGTYASIEDARSSSDTEGTLLHESRSWAEPPLDTFDPPIVIPGDRGLRLTCTYRNDGDDYVGFGLDFEDEMCFLWAYWY
ncbi:MAG: hypothetical protein J0L92_23235 [Deltaproteobacteria bacterium]|nr:hypothetical protein [Deltaproteobacteria bacterium]